jgi:hypothetical protein
MAAPSNKACAMIRLGQMAAIIAIAAGAGLFAFSRHLDPPVNLTNPASVMSASRGDHHEVAAMACGWGVAFMTLGGLGLAVPWVNACVKKQCASAPGLG